MTGTERPEPAGPTDDPAEVPAYLAPHVVTALAAAPDVAVLDLDVRVVHGALLVNGTVESVEQRDAALAEARRAAAPCPVRDGITVLALHDPHDAEELP